MRPSKRRARAPWVLLFSVLALLASACTGGFGTYEAPVAAVVGGTRISDQTVVSVVRILSSAQQFQSLFQGPGSNISRVNAKRDILTNLIREQVIAEQAPALGVSVTPTAVQAAMDRIRQNFPMPGAFLKALQGSGITLAQLTSYQRLTLIGQLVQAKVTAGINASASQIDAAYQANKSTFDAEYHAAEIRICAHTDASGNCQATPQDLATAQKVIQQAQAGASFARLARQYSADTANKASGGDMGWADPGSLLPAFEQAALALKPGQVSPQPLQTPFGYYVIKLLGLGRSVADASSAINAQLEQPARQQAFSAYLGKTMAATRILVNPIYGQYDPTTLSVISPPGAEPSPSPSPAAIPGLGGP
jgi:parvulin-like peptidyl-prolyl isomerase